MVLRVACRLRGGHDYTAHWRRIPRPDGGVDLQLCSECTRCPTTVTPENYEE